MAPAAPYTPTPTALVSLATALASDPSIHARLVRSGEVGLASDTWDDKTLTRWLVAEGGDVQKAVARLANHAEWRAALLTDGWTEEKERIIEAELIAGKTWAAPAPDTAGRPLLLTASNRHLRSTRDKQAMTLALVYAMDVASKQADERGDGGVVSIVDARGVRFAHLDNAVAKLVVEVAQEHYPERALHTHVYGAPRAFAALISWLLRFIAPATRGKVTFVNGPPVPATWENAACIEVDALSAGVGGRGAAAVPVQDAARAVGLVKGAEARPPPKVWAPYGVPARAAGGGKEDYDEAAGVSLTADASTAAVT